MINLGSAVIICFNYNPKLCVACRNIEVWEGILPKIIVVTIGLPSILVSGWNRIAANPA